jgi:fumarylacetoacetate (FAA) hydrolase family protein
VTVGWTLMDELESWRTPGGPLSGALIGRIHLPPSRCPRGVGGPTPVAIRPDGVYDLLAEGPTVADLLERDDVVDVVRCPELPRIADLHELVDASHYAARQPDRPALLSPFDLQVVRACGVTFATSLIERVIEEGARGDRDRARAIRAQLGDAIGGDLRSVRPGSESAAVLKRELIASGLWSQYLEVGIGPHAEIFTKAPVLASVGFGDRVGVRRDSAWNNSEPEVVLAVDTQGRIVGATLGNDVNLRDFEGRSALLLPEAKDNNASSSLGPWIRLFEPGFGLPELMATQVELEVSGTDGFETRGANQLSSISRDPEALVAQAIGRTHQYPDGLALFLGTMYVPTDDRSGSGSGFTHHVDDLVRIANPLLGSLVNWVGYSEELPPWTFGLRALQANLAART